MAELRLENGASLTDPTLITDTLAPLGVAVAHWPIGDAPQLAQLLAQPALSDAEKEQVLAQLDHYFQELQQQQGYQSRDLIVLHPNVPGLNDMLAKFDRCHTHDDDEVRYIVDGEGVFGFVFPEGDQAKLTLTQGEYINVPRDTEHWFHLTETKRIKAVRYFTNTEGWTPHYTGTPIRTF